MKVTGRAEGFLLKSRVYHESACPCSDKAGLTCYILGLRYWNSDDERTPPPQAVPRPFTGVTCYTVLQTGILRKDDHATRCFEPTEMNMFTRWNQMTRRYSSSSIGYAA